MTTENTITKFAMDQVGKINKAHAPEQLRRLGQHCVRQAYAGNLLDTQYALDNLMQWARMPMASWLRSMGLVIDQPAVNSARFTVKGVKDQKNQRKAIELAKDKPVMVAEHAVKREKKPVVLKGTEDERVQSSIEKLIARLKKDDPAAAGLLNDIWTRKAIEYYIKEQQPELKAA
jgi:hypothetical protein